MRLAFIVPGRAGDGSSLRAIATSQERGGREGRMMVG